MMKKLSAALFVSIMAISCTGQPGNDKKVKSKTVASNINSLLWQVSGNGLDKPSYLFGTMHMLCKEDAFISDSMKKAIQETDAVYFELDMDNFIDMLGAMTKMKMKNDTTLADLLTKEEFNKVKAYIENKGTLLPFSVLQTYKPFVASSMLMEASMVCDEQVSMEQLIMTEAKSQKKKIEGLETTSYQMGIFDSIPYKVQAEELLKMVAVEGKQADGEKEFNELMKAYREQNINKLGEMIAKSEAGMMKYEDLLLNNRNRNWVIKLQKLMPEKPVLVAVGAGHLPGKNGVITLLRNAGYSVTPVENKPPKKVSEI